MTSNLGQDARTFFQSPKPNATVLGTTGQPKGGTRRPIKKNIQGYAGQPKALPIWV